MTKSLLINKELDVLESGTWGTIGPRSRSAATALSKYVGAEYGLLCHSKDAAYEALIRQFELSRGNRVLVGEFSDPADSLIALCAGATPVFAPVCQKCGMLSPKKLEKILDSNEKPNAVVLDILPEAFDEYPLSTVYELTRSHNVALILNVGGAFSLKWNGTPLTKYADAAFYSLEVGSEIYCVGGGFIATDSNDIYSAAYAYHNCGRSFGEGSTIDIQGIVGGNLRANEFSAVIAEHILETGEFSTLQKRVLEKMDDQPVFQSDYAKKMIEAK